MLELQNLQRKLSLKKKGSNNRSKLKFRIAKLYEKITNSRSDNLHKISKRIIDENQVIFLEDLGVKGMLESSFRNLARNISDVSWGIFVNMLKHKSELYGKYIFEINPRNTSKMCSNCYEVNSDLKLKDREWKCNGCHTKHDRDINAACNMLRLGQGLPEYKALLAA